jgi:hypothetical protein
VRVGAEELGCEPASVSGSGCVVVPSSGGVLTVPPSAPAVISTAPVLASSVGLPVSLGSVSSQASCATPPAALGGHASDVSSSPVPPAPALAPVSVDAPEPMLVVEVVLLGVGPVVFAAAVVASGDSLGSVEVCDANSHPRPSTWQTAPSSQALTQHTRCSVSRVSRQYPDAHCRPSSQTEPVRCPLSVLTERQPATDPPSSATPTSAWRNIVQERTSPGQSWLVRKCGWGCRHKSSSVLALRGQARC